MHLAVVWQGWYINMLLLLALVLLAAGSQDGPVWMVSHKVNETGAFPDNKTGVLDVAASHPIDQAHYNRHEYATEPQLSMWLMYACPYQLNGMVYTCQSRKLAVRNSGTTFIAVERTLSPVGAASVADLHRPAAEFNRVQVCFWFWAGRLGQEHM